MISYSPNGSPDKKIFNSKFFKISKTNPKIEYYSNKPLHPTTTSNPLIFVGSEDSYLIPILFMQKEKFKFSEIQIFDQTDPVTHNTGGLLMKRYNLITKAKKAEIFGIIVVNSNV